MVSKFRLILDFYSDNVYLRSDPTAPTHNVKNKQLGEPATQCSWLILSLTLHVVRHPIYVSISLNTRNINYLHLIFPREDHQLPNHQ